MQDNRTLPKFVHLWFDIKYITLHLLPYITKSSLVCPISLLVAVSMSISLFVTVSWKTSLYLSGSLSQAEPELLNKAVVLISFDTLFVSVC